MNLDIFKPNDEDGAFLAYIKREALAHITKYCEEVAKEYWYDYYKALTDFIIASQNSPIKNSFSFIDNILDKKDYLRKEIPLHPIDITKDDFDISESNGFGHHKRCFCISWDRRYNFDKEKALYYAKAFTIQVRKEFDFVDKEVNEKDYIEEQQPIFISKGGVINGDYIEYTYFRKKDYSDGKLSVKLPIKIPVAEVLFINKSDETEFIYVVDHREPALKELMEVYNCEIENDERIASYKLNLRNCKIEYRAKKDYTKITFPKPEICKRGAYETIEDNGAVCLKSASGILAKWVDGHVTIYYNLVRYKKINNNYWIWFTGRSLINLKTIYNRGNNNISFIY